MTTSEDRSNRGTEIVTATGLSEDPPRQAPPAGSDLHPGPLLRRGWRRVLLTTVAASLVLLPLLSLLPTSATARFQVVVTEPGIDPTLSATVEPSSQEQIQRLLVDLESPDTVATAARRADVAISDVSVQSITERDALVAEVSITAPTDDAALRIAEELPALVAEERGAGIGERSSEVTSQLRDQADAALERAAALETEIDSTQPPLPAAARFVREQRRDALIAEYERLLTRAAEIDLAIPTRSVGFAVSATPTLAPGGFPPPPPESAVLVGLIGLVAGVGLVLGRSVVSARLQREHFPTTMGGRHLGLIDLHGRPRASDGDGTASAVARLRALPELRGHQGRLVSLLALDVPAEVSWQTSSALGRRLAESGMDVAVLSLAHEPGGAAGTPRDAHPEAAMWIDSIDAPTSTSSPGRCALVRAWHRGDSALANVYSRTMRTVIHRYRSGHDLLLVDPSASGVAGWLEDVYEPDLTILLVGEGVTSRTTYEDARARLSQGGIATVSLLVSSAPRRPRSRERSVPASVAHPWTVPSAAPERPTADVS